ncbi:MAG: hypothetical protein M3169_09650 [Candidatus Eremiobacteraeota bacterium]|nr:hypothetical protein [Candidatus Eremiobacteraeota bacterium]
MPFLTRTLALVAIVAAALLGAGGFAALAQSTQSTQRAAGGARATMAAPTPPPLPFGDAARGAQGSKRSTEIRGSDDGLRALARLSLAQRGNSVLDRYNGPRVPMPKLTDLLKHKVRWKKSASGGTIVLTGTSNTAYLDDQTLSYGAQVYWLCQNLQPSTKYQYVMFSPDGYAYTVRPYDYVARAYSATSWFQTDAQGRCLQANAGTTYPFYASEALATPLASSPDPIVGIGAANPKVAADPPYSGVWAVAMQNQATNQFEAVAYSVVLGTLNFGTYSDPAHSVKTSDFTSGSNVYVTASGLNPAHFYAFGFVNTSGNGLPCVATVPWNAQNNNNATCFVAGGTGVLPTGGVISGQFVSPATGANSAGTYTVQLYDVTTSDLISTQQMSVNPSTVTWSPLIPYNGATTGVNLGDTFATDGIINIMPGGALAEQSVQGLTYQASGVTSGRVYRMTISNGNGVVMSGTTTDPTNFQPASPQAFSLPAQFTAASTSTGAQKLAFPLNIANLTAFGATQTPFASNVYTAQLYDVAAGTVVGSKSFTILSYQGSFQWTAPPGAYVNVAPLGAATNVTTTFRNGAGVLYGNWNGDSIKAITITNDSGNQVSLGRQGGVTTATDSSNQIWNIANPNAQTLTLTPAVAGQALPVNGTIAIPMTVAAAAGSCASVCALRTSITPLHGVAASGVNNTMTNTATNGLDVFGAGVVGTNTQASYSWKIGAYSAAQLGTPRYNQMMYRSGTDSAAGGSYTITITVVNNGSPKPLQNIEFIMPPTVDPNQKTPQMVSAVINGVTQAAGTYFIETQNGGNNASADPTRLTIPNAFGIVTKKAASAVPVGGTGVFTITQPILLTAFPFQEVGATGNYYDSSGTIGGPSFPIGPTNTLTNAVAGTTNIDSTELAVFSLDPTLMSATLTPTVLPAQAGRSTLLKIVNTTTGLDPNPDYISQLLLTLPNGAIPNSISVTSPNQSGVTWNANPTGTAGQWLIDLCAVSTAPNPATQASTPCAGNTDLNALPPGAELDITLNYTTAPTLGSYKIAWTIVGANGGAVVAAAAPQQPTLTIANTTAMTAFTYSGGYMAAPAYPPAPLSPIQAVPAGTEPIVGSWGDFTNGNAFVYELNNNGTTPISDISLAIPSSNTSGKFGDPAGWKIMQPTIHVYGAGAAGAQCSGNGIKSLVQAVPGAPGTQGLLMLSGCNLLPGQVLDIFFDAQNPYDTTLANPVFAFNASVATGGAVPPDPRVAANINTLPAYQLSNTERIVIDARLVIQIPTGSPGAYAPALYGGSAPVVNCLACTFTTGGAYPLINLNQIVGTFTAQDSLAATVYSDSTNGWNLSVSSDLNPSTSSGQISTWVSANSSNPGVGTYTRNVAAGPGSTIPTAGTLTLSNFTGAVRKQPIDNIMSYTVTVNPLSVNNNVTTTATLTYTLIAN